MNNEHEFAVGDIVTARDGNDNTKLWVGVVQSFTATENSPRVRFWNPVQRKLVATVLVMQRSGLTFIGRVPDWAEWDV
jgi:hypothetical protein